MGTRQGCRAGRTGCACDSAGGSPEAQQREEEEPGLHSPLFLPSAARSLGDHLVPPFAMARKSRVSHMSKAETTQGCGLVAK